MGSIEQLKDLMSLNSCIEIADFEKHSGQIAKLLFGELAIRKGNTLYLFKENELEKYGFEVIEMRFNNKVDFPSSELYWAYIYGAQNEAYKMMESRKVGKVVSLQRVMRGLMVEAPQNETFTLV